MSLQLPERARRIGTWTIVPASLLLLGACSSANGYYDPQDDDVPLRAWIRSRHGDDAVDP